MVHVIIPTASRPAMLRTALRSVAEQTAVGAISQVLVSENGGNRESEAVCREFPSLPITYVFRTPSTSAMDHGRILIKDHLQDELVAFLHDDDWWAPDFLGLACATLSAYPRASTYCCCSYYVAGENSLLGCNENLHFWFGADYPPLQPVWKISEQGVLLASLVGTPTHYSSMVIRTEALRQAAIVYETDNWYDSDRAVIFELARLGTIVYSPLPHSFYRWHGSQQTETFALERRKKQMEATAEWMIERSGVSWARAGEIFAERARRCPPAAQARLASVAMEVWCVPLLARHGAPSSAIRQLHDSYLRLQPSAARKWARYLLPPVLRHGASTLHKKIAKARG